MKYVNGDGSGPFDIVPVDFVVNGMLISTCKGAMEQNYFEVYNAGTSYSNQITVKDYRNIGLKAYSNKRFSQQQFKAVVNFIPSKFEFDFRKNIEEYIPIKLFQYFAKSPLGSEKLQEKAANIEFLYRKLDGMLGIFKFFMDGTWVFESQKILNLLQEISFEEQHEFECDVRHIDFHTFLSHYADGIQIWCMGDE